MIVLWKERDQARTMTENNITLQQKPPQQHHRQLQHQKQGLDNLVTLLFSQFIVPFYYFNCLIILVSWSVLGHILSEEQSKVGSDGVSDDGHLTIVQCHHYHQPPSSDLYRSSVGILPVTTPLYFYFLTHSDDEHLPFTFVYFFRTNNAFTLFSLLIKQQNNALALFSFVY